MSPSNSTLEYIIKRTERKCPNKNLNMNIQSTTISNRQNIETTQVSITCLMDKQKWYIQTVEYYLPMKRNKVPMHAAMRMKS